MTVTFRHISEPTAEVIAKIARTEFLQILDLWSIKNSPVFRRKAPPIHALSGPGLDAENIILASVFKAMACSYLVTEQLAHVLAAITVHERQRDMLVKHARGTRNHHDLRDRSVHVECRKIELMLDVLHLWLAALHERACE